MDFVSEKISIVDINDDDINNFANNSIKKDIYDEISKIDNESDVDSEKDVDFSEPCMDKPVIEVSPNGTYLIIYNPKDHSIVGWNTKDIDEGKLTSKDITIKIEIPDDCYIDQIRVSDNKKLACMVHKGDRCYPKIIDIRPNQEIELDLITGSFNESCHTFNLKGEYILYCKWGAYSVLSHREHKIIWIYSTKTKNNKWFCKSNYKLPEYFELINMSKYSKIYLFSNNSIYEWDIFTKQDIKIFHDREFEENKLKNDVRVSSNSMFICLGIMDKIIIISIELAIPIVSLDINNDTLLYELMDQSDLLPSLPSLLPLLSNKIQIMGSKYEYIQTTDEYAFGMLDGFVWKIKLEENISKIKFLLQNSNEKVIENSKYNYDNNFKIDKGTYEHLNIYLFNPYVDKMHELFQKVSESENEYKKKIEQKNKDLMKQYIITDELLQVWKVKVIDRNKIMLRVFKKVIDDWKLTCTRITEFNVPVIRKIKLLEIRLFTDNDIILITTIGILIYHFNENKKSISLNYWNYLELTYPSVSRIFQRLDNFNDFKVLLRPYTFQHNLPLPNYLSFKTSDEWISYIKDNKENLLKYGNELLSFAIKEHRLDLIEEIYKECMNRFEEDLGNNWMFLSIITSTMPLLNKHYPEYVLRYSLETTMIIDRPMYSIEDQQNNLHLYSFQYLQLIDLTRSILCPFVETMSREIYKTWNGEAIINFKWNTYGRYYYMMIWIGFMAYLGCFTAAATIPQQYIDDNIQKKLLIASIVLGFIHLSFEVRQVIYDPIKWLLDFWNLFDMIAYLLPIYTSIHWLQVNEMNDKIISLLSFSCLFLDLKFLLFFRAFEYFGVSDFSLNTYSINNDPNNPWNLATTYNQIFENGTVDSNPFLIQPPNGNTNMFVDFRTSLFAMYKFLTGDSSALSNWPYISDPPLAILIVLFSLLIVVYLMNLLIGLLNNAIEKDHDRVSFLMQKAEILAEIELYYMLPYQRRRKDWFPEVIYYYASLDDIQKRVKRMMKRDEWNQINAFPKLKQDLLKKINIQHNPDDES
ncbi:hypothetical protein GLOIN_2v1874127 [Rhizophagus clarus]|uniref:Ion transport domain-containing protein n=1 Tax=Rhizophagus clarus TaxID=94130 RepID=A0A8H3MCF3_9GLOM|nr:hypothetical protein GLOIN_2v1874127 [Rhizophagus clarus]